ncbi:MAG: hypothetical protein Q9186_000733 [Xanthomendoza sp. 1 TL-2023]
MASPIDSAPTTPSDFWSRSPRSPNSWTALSFTTLHPSDSPSQALFPKHSRVSLLHADRTDNGRTIRPPHTMPALNQQMHHQPSSVHRNAVLMTFTALLHISIIILTIILVLVLTAATSHPSKHIHPTYYVGIMLSFAASIISAVVVYVKYNERKRFLRNGATTLSLHPTTAPDIELGHLPPPHMTTSRGLGAAKKISNWHKETGVPIHQRVRSMMLAQNPLTIATARIAGSNNLPRDPNMKQHPPLPPRTRNPEQQQQQQQRHYSSNTAAALQHFLEHELRRQEAVKRRISTWLRGVIHTSPPNPPSPAPPPPPPPPRTQPQKQQTPLTPRGDPTRLAELTQEIESYLGIPAPPLAGQKNPYHGFGISDKDHLRHVRKEIGVVDDDEDEDEEEEEEETPIDYATLPPAIPRLGAKGRDPMLSDPVTVVWAPMNPQPPHSHSHPHPHPHPPSSSSSSRKAAEIGIGLGIRGGGEQQHFVTGEMEDVVEEARKVERGKERGRDDFAEMWVRRVVKGVDVGSAGVGVGGKEKERKKKKGGWRWGGLGG